MAELKIPRCLLAIGALLTTAFLLLLPRENVLFLYLGFADRGSFQHGDNRAWPQARDLRPTARILQSDSSPDIVRQDGTTYLMNGLDPSTPCTVAAIHNDVAASKRGKKQPHKAPSERDGTRGGDTRDAECDIDEQLELNQERVVAGMTLGSVAFQMSLFYLVNHRDRDLRRYSYGVIGETLSIFCSVLTFNTAYAFVEEKLHENSEIVECLTFFVMFLSFFLLMEVVVMHSSRKRGEGAEVRSKLHGRKLKAKTHVLNAKTFGSCAAQMSGAATLQGFGHLQFLAYHRKHSLLMLGLVVPFAFLVIWSLMWLFSYLRKKLILIDAYMDEAELTWVEVAEESENEICSLCLGFLASVWVRAVITGDLPDMLMHGFVQTEEAVAHTYHEMFLLNAAGFLSACGSTVVVLTNYGHISSTISLDTLRTSLDVRFLRIFIKSLTMCFAWCTCFAMHIIVAHFSGVLEGVRFRLLLAITQSIGAFLLILGLDFISDMDCTGAAFDKAVVMLIEALGVSVGLSWEHGFHECVEIAVAFMAEDESGIFSMTDDPKIWSIFLSGTIVCTVLPAYRLYVVPTRYLLIEEYEAAQHKEEEHYRLHSPRADSPRSVSSLFRGATDVLGSLSGRSTPTADRFEKRATRKNPTIDTNLVRSDSIK